jgi:hypothetical protein
METPTVHSPEARTASAITPVVPSVRGKSATTSTISVAPREVPRWIEVINGNLSKWGATSRTLEIVGLYGVFFGAVVLPVGGLVQSWVGTMALLIAATVIQLRPVLERLADDLDDKGADREEWLSGFPALIADAAVLVCFGYAASSIFIAPVLGWTTTVFALLLSHVATLRLRAFPLPAWIELVGPKQLMLTVSVACLVAALLPYEWRQAFVLLVLIVTSFGSGAVLWLRVARAAPLR